MCIYTYINMLILHIFESWLITPRTLFGTHVHVYMYMCVCEAATLGRQTHFNWRRYVYTHTYVNSHTLRNYVCTHT